jgi:opacity protein-like surface antigen
MKFIKYSIVASFLATSAIAADLPSKSAPLPPTRVADAISDTSWYGGLAVGGIYKDSNKWYNDIRLSVMGGYEFNSLMRAELDFDYKHSNHTNDRAYALVGNGIGQFKLPFIPVVPYAIAGVGYRLSDTKNEPIWNVGAGVRYELTSSIDLDGRYRYVSDFKRTRDENVVSIGASYKF